MDNKEIIKRLGIVRNKSNLSARELSLRIGMSPQYISQVESGRISLSIEKLITILEVCDCPIDKFFYKNFEDYDIDMSLIKEIKSLPSKKKLTLLDFLNNIIK